MQQTQQITIEKIDIEGNGIGRIDGKAVFVNGALPDEVVEIEITKRKPNFDKAKLINILKPSDKRVDPLCENFGICGGCSLQHIDFETQVMYKQQVLVDNLKHIGNVELHNVLPPLYGREWGYRYRARLSAKYVTKKGGALVGFREKGAPYVVNMDKCHVLPKQVSDLITPLKELINPLSIATRIPQIEVAVGDSVIVLLFRIMEPLSPEDEVLIKQFTDNYNANTSELPLQIWVQPSGIETQVLYYPLENTPKLSYSIPSFNITMPYFPSEFTQVNPYINQEMMDLAIKLLAPKENESILDLFCGIGNFTLPIATLANKVMGIEGNNQLVKRALENATLNNLANKTQYKVTNLFKIDSQYFKDLGKFDKWLIDPPRDGAYEVVQSITKDIAPNTIVYVSCNPATLARDAGVLVNTHGYKLVSAGVMNMFPHTSHIESIALFQK